MPAAAKVTNAILHDIEDANNYNYTSVPTLPARKKHGLLKAMLNRYYIDTCLGFIESWERHVANVLSILVFCFIAKSLYTLCVLVAEKAAELM